MPGGTIMENIGIVKLKAELERLNPHVQLDVCTYTGVPFNEYIKCYSFTSSDFIIIANVPGENLHLPDGYYFNEKNGITNKHKTESGIYECFDFEYDFAHFAPKAAPQKSIFARLFAR